MDQYERGCCVKRLFLIQACVSVSEVSLDSSCAVGRYGSVFKKRSKTLRDHKRLVRLESGRLTPAPDCSAHKPMRAQVRERTQKRRLDPSCRTETIVFACGKENFVALTPLGERNSKNGDSGGYDLHLQILCGFRQRRLLAHLLKFCTLLCQR